MLLAILLTGCFGGDPKPPKDLDAIDASVVPAKRSEILAVGDEATNSVLVFGGNDGPIVSQIPTARFREDTWLFQPGKGWTEVAGPHPHARGRYALEADPAGRRALLFGGRFRPEGESGSYELFSDLWAFDFDERAWTQLHDGEGGPDPRYYPASGYDADTGTLYVWGGATNTSATNLRPSADLWAWNGTAWREVDTSGDAPSTRVFFGSTWDPGRKRIVVFGGQIGDFQSQAYRDLFALDVTTGVWEELSDGQGGPSTRMHAHMQYDAAGDRYLLFGGHTDIGDGNDLWAFDPTDRAWTQIYEADTFTGADLGCLGNPSEVPADYVDMDLSAPERRHRGMFSLLWGNLWVFGGIHAECSDQLDDTWRFDLSDDAWHELIDATSGESCARRGDDCECLCL